MERGVGFGERHYCSPLAKIWSAQSGGRSNAAVPSRRLDGLPWAALKPRPRRANPLHSVQRPSPPTCFSTRRTGARSPDYLLREPFEVALSGLVAHAFARDGRAYWYR